VRGRLNGLWVAYGSLTACGGLKGLDLGLGKAGERVMSVSTPRF